MLWLLDAAKAPRASPPFSPLSFPSNLTHPIVMGWCFFGLPSHFVSNNHVCVRMLKRTTTVLHRFLAPPVPSFWHPPYVYNNATLHYNLDHTLRTRVRGHAQRRRSSPSLARPLLLQLLLDDERPGSAINRDDAQLPLSSQFLAA